MAEGIVSDPPGTKQFIQYLSQYLFQAFYLSVIILGTEDTAGNKTDKNPRFVLDTCQAHYMYFHSLSTVPNAVPDGKVYLQ